MKVCLFDMDGVLIEPGGYRAAFIAVMNYFGKQMGMGEIAPAIAEIELFEAQSITSEWDMIALSMADIVVGAGEKLPAFPPTFHDFIQQMRETAVAPFRPDYARIAQEVGEAWDRARETPAQTGLRLHTARSRPQALPILEELLANTHDVFGSPTTRIFQHYTLGDAAFQQCYETAPLFITSSLLQLYDRTAVSPEMSKRILAAIADGALCAAVYTARPSLPPAAENARGYAPEAELAIGLTGLESLPLIGAGRMNWLSSRMGKADGAYIKPSPVQALAAIGAALSGDEEAALIAAERITYGKLTDFWQIWLREPLEIHVFEDSTGGIEAALKARELLQEAGFSVRAIGYGIAAVPHKIEALAAVADRVYPSVNAALRHFFGSVPMPLPTGDKSPVY